jgi:hypothetical protein
MNVSFRRLVEIFFPQNCSEHCLGESFLEAREKGL